MRSFAERIAARLDIDGHFNILVGLVEHRHDAINREARKLGLPDARKVRHRKAGELMGATNCQLCSSRIPMIWADRIALSCSTSGLAKPRSRNTLPLPRISFIVGHFSASFRARPKTGATSGGEPPLLVLVGRLDKFRPDAAGLAIGLAEKLREGP